MALSVRYISILLVLVAAPRIALTQRAPQRTLTPFRSEAELNRFLNQVIQRREEEEARQRARWSRRSNATVPVCSTGGDTTRITHRSGDSTVTIAGYIRDQAHQPIAGAQTLVVGSAYATTTDQQGRFSLTLQAARWDSARITIRAQYIGYAPSEVRSRVSAGDSLYLVMPLCQRAVEVGEINVRVETAPSITNDQTAGVDEGDIVKLHGHYLVVLRRGRLFTVDIRQPRLTPVGMVDAYGPGIDPGGTWYDELLIYGDKVAVIGYSYRRGGTELGLFRIDDNGGLAYLSTWQLGSSDYYSSRNYASRLVGSRLVLYSPVPIYRNPYGFGIPQVRKWRGDSSARFTPILTSGRAFIAAGMSPGSNMVMHTITSCDLAAEDVRCAATVVFGPPQRVFYMSADAIYLWMSSWWRRGDDQSAVVRMPLDDAAPTALRVRGSPEDQLSFLEQDGWLNVLVRSDARGDAMWRAESSPAKLSLLRVALASFGDGSAAAPGEAYRSVPSAPGWSLSNRFVGNYLLYGSGSGWRSPASKASREVVVVPIGGGEISRISIGHPVDRIEPTGQSAVVMGSDEHALHVSGIDLGMSPRLARAYVLDSVAESESRTHGFFYHPEGADSGVFGFAVAREGRERWRQLYEGSAAVVYLRTRDDGFTMLGELAAGESKPSGDACHSSCMDWYGNARPIFISDRVFALLGYEIVEGQISSDGIHERSRVNFTPRRASGLPNFVSGFCNDRHCQ